MAEQIITKRCSHCKRIKPLDEYYKDKSTPDGLYYSCKKCHNERTKSYAQTPKGRKNACKGSSKYRKKNRPKINEYQRKYYHKYKQTPEGKETYNRYSKTEKGIENSHRQRKRYRKQYPDKFKAHQAMRNAVRSGKMPQANTQKCTCEKQAYGYHHYLGYAKEHWFDVIPLCFRCHFIVHNIITQ